MTLQCVRIKIEPAYRKVSKAIEEKILTGQIRIGDVLLSETALAQQLSVNRSTGHKKPGSASVTIGPVLLRPLNMSVQVTAWWCGSSTGWAAPCLTCLLS
jgi:hypothetical protein